MNNAAETNAVARVLMVVWPMVGVAQAFVALHGADKVAMMSYRDIVKAVRA